MDCTLYSFTPIYVFFSLLDSERICRGSLN